MESEMWYRNRKELPPGAAAPKEVVFEVITASDDIGFGVAIADIQQSQRHYHKTTLETYTLVAGELRVYVGEKVDVLRAPGQTLSIPVNTPHCAESIGGGPARLVVFSIPAWTPEDHLLV